MLSDPAFASQIAHLVISLPPLDLNYVAGTRSLLLPKHLHLQLRGVEGDSFGGFRVDAEALRERVEDGVEFFGHYNECKQGFWRQPSGKWVPATWNKREVPEWFVRALEPSRPPTD